MTVLERIRRTNQQQALWSPGCRILAAVSGGSDSVAMLLLLRELEADGALTVAGVAHLHHQLRGAEADEDERFCAALAAAIGVPFIAERADVPALAKAQRRSIEDAARAARYAFFERASQACSADVVATAHTRDDQAETFLLRLLRGAGTRGLAGIRPRTGRVIRPLLEVDRAALRAYLAGRGQSFREDASNADVSVPRNRVRHELLPLLRSRFSPRITDVLARESALARHDEEFLHEEAIKLARRLVLTNETVTIDAAGLAGAPRALASRVALEALGHLAGGRSISFDHVEWVLALAADSAGAVSLPGQEALRVGDRIVLRRSARNCTPHTAGIGHRTPGIGFRNAFAFSLSIPGEVHLAPQGISVAAQHLAASAVRPSQWMARGAEVGVASDAVTLPLAVRSRRPGDRFRPLGAPGKRKLQDFFVDRKVPRNVRDTVPLVVDGRDRIVWVVGESVADEFRVTDASQGVILLAVRHLGGPG
jgi:tRNA(Ile)-lysidine synthase